MKTITKWKLELICIFMFFLIFPLTINITFMQNDDWVYYGMVKNFMAGDFRLSDLSAPTFYAQGIPAALVAMVFGVQLLPFLTLLVSTISFYLVLKILIYHFKAGFFSSVLLALLLLFNPLSLYSVLGFMSEYYFMLYTLVGLYFILRYEQSEKPKTFVLANVFIVLSFFVRQLGLVLSLAFVGSLLIRKKYKQALIQIILSILVYGFYILVFPKTPEMLEKPLTLSKFSDFKYIFSLGYCILIYLSAFSLPIFVAIAALYKRISAKVIAVGVVCLVIFVVANKYFEPLKLIWGTFPYLQNTWEQTGLYPRTITGNKYDFIGMPVVFMYWSFVAKLFVGFFIMLPILKKQVNIFLLYIGIYVAVLFLTPEIYDRYLLPLFFMSMFYLLSLYPQIVSSKVLKFSLVLFLFPLIIFGYQLAVDFVGVNNFVWTKSNELVSNSGVDPKDVKGTNAWKLTYKNPPAIYKYMFSYDSYTAQPELACCWKLLEIKDLKYNGSIFINPKVYLYEKVQIN